ncbi:MAG: hypothetical protein LKF74_04025 [Megasphaera sp.]|jgi:hypothetical protein|nr:hypothetical protein [Megasphaera sp.]MCH4187985.1 hypothetical protein [Megasphaera sp.]MCH4217705.1 hypothetical protein [Megasphaera sp.]
MMKLKPKDILFRDPYFEQSVYCQSADMRETKRIDILGKWYKTDTLADTLLHNDEIIFTHGTAADPQRRLIFRVYEKAAKRLFINSYFWTNQLNKEVYMGTIHIEQYDTVQTLNDASYTGIIELIMIDRDTDMMELAPEVKPIQTVKNHVAKALGLHLLAACTARWDGSAEEDTLLPLPDPDDTPANDQEDALRQEQRRRLEDKEQYEAVIAAQDATICDLQETIKKQAQELALYRKAGEKKHGAAIKQTVSAHHPQPAATNAAPPRQTPPPRPTIQPVVSPQEIEDKEGTVQEAMDAQRRQRLTDQQTAAHPQPSTAPPAEKDGLDIPDFMSQHDYTVDLDKLLRHLSIAMVGGNEDWYDRLARRFPPIYLVQGHRSDYDHIAEADILVVHRDYTQDYMVRQAMKTAHANSTAICYIDTYNLNNFAKKIMKTS